MRKYFVFLAVFFGLAALSSPALAGKYDDDCAVFKGEKRLYGLCTAYQNALVNEDEEAMADIFANWQKWVDEDGMPQLPGHDYGQEEEPVCPCWSESDLDLIAALMLLACEVNFDGAFVLTIYAGSAFVEAGVGNAYAFDSNLGDFVRRPDSCELSVDGVMAKQFIGLEGDDYDLCLGQLADLIERDFADIECL